MVYSDSTLERSGTGNISSIGTADGGFLLFNPLWKPLSPDLAVVSRITLG